MSTGGRWRRPARGEAGGERSETGQTRRNPSGISSGREAKPVASEARQCRQAVISGRLTTHVLTGRATNLEGVSQRRFVALGDSTTEGRPSARSSSPFGNAPPRAGSTDPTG